MTFSRKTVFPRDLLSNAKTRGTYAPWIRQTLGLVISLLPKMRFFHQKYPLTALSTLSLVFKQLELFISEFTLTKKFTVIFVSSLHRIKTTPEIW